MDYEDRIIRVLSYIHDNPAGDLSLDALADVAALSRFHWHRVFHAISGETCAQAVRRIRLHRASFWLITTEMNWEDITEACGQDSPRAFARLFSQRYGKSPAAFRAAGEMRPALPLTPKGATQMYPVEIQTLPARILAGMPHRGNYFEISHAFEKAGALFGARGMWPQIQGMAGVYYDDPDSVPIEELRSFAGGIVADGVEIAPPLERLDLPAGRHGVLRYKGPYTGLKAAYEYLYGQWLPGSGETPAEFAVYEIYLNSPMDTAPEDLLTDICMPLAEGQ